MRRRQSQSVRRARRSRSRGAVLLEAVACVQLLALLSFGIMEVGFAYRHRLVEASGARGAARVASNAADAPSADWQAIQALRGAIATIPQAQVDRVVFYKADIDGNPTNASCLTTAVVAARGVSGACNVYSAADIFAATVANFGSTANTTCAGTWDANWCPTTRVQPSTAVVGDNIGVWISVRYLTMTGLFSFTQLTMTDKYVMRLEPEIS